MSNLETAIKIALEAHGGQTGKDGEPYILHPLRVMMSVSGETVRCAAVLHDVVEDTAVTLDDLTQAGLPEEVVEAVDCLTKREGEDYNTYLARVKGNPIAVQVKRGDLQDNMNILRLPRLEEKDLKRLQKYRMAWDYINGEGG